MYKDYSIVSGNFFRQRFFFLIPENVSLSMKKK